MHLYRILTSINFGLLRKDFLAKVWWIAVYVAGWLAISSPYFQVSSFLLSRLTLNFYPLRYCNFILNNWKHLGVIFTLIFTTGVCICPSLEVFVRRLPLLLRFAVNLQHCLVYGPRDLADPRNIVKPWTPLWLRHLVSTLPEGRLNHQLYVLLTVNNTNSSSELEAIAPSCLPDVSHTMSFCRGKQVTQGRRDWHSNCEAIPVVHIGLRVCPKLQSTLCNVNVKQLCKT